ncbi:hypothetical protein PAP_01315 [Palaeococcus pacificus DY20341]|uniref:Transcription regulator TrmB C-terminal domain-containing protein n=1 Tax=Palaeococcus pacificus DY20341 TaxID=1343739 RepID=A0A075LPU5_9EURY|nr:TrmB family transcriptional regulator sugar-binding domain-containing protein [Palaeococcus pacificus]AIF68705.1 hypothetical protein PAP_01315 [Palaeococcus pacificus DY20341]
MNNKKAFALIVVIALLGIVVNSYLDHYQGGEIYEAANRGFSLLTQGFNVTVVIETVDGKTLEGELFSVDGSTIYIVKDGKRLTVGGPSATKEDIKAKHIEIKARGSVYTYELPPRSGKYRDVIKDLKVDAYSERFSGIIYVKGLTDPIMIGKLKYSVDYLTYGSIDVKQTFQDGVILTAGMVPIEILERYIGDKEVYMYGTLYVNSEERNLPLRVLGVKNI